MTRKRVGEITLPSGALTIFDPGYIAMRETGELETIPTVVIGALPKDRTLPVWGARVGSGRWKDCWDHIAIEVSKKKSGLEQKSR